jgi:GNAT superfamily N-acetyltransferase
MSRGSESPHELFVGRVARLGALPPNRRAAELYRLSKEVGGHREGTGTFPLLAARVNKLYELVVSGGDFYEPLGTYGELLNMVEVNGVLARGRAPVRTWNRLSVSVRLFESVYGAPLGMLPLPESGEAEQGVHNVSLIGAPTSSGGLRFVNSWGGAWGDGGRGVLSREYIERYMVEAWLGRSAGGGPTRFAAPLFERSDSDPAAFAAAWVPTLPGLILVGSAAIDRRLRHNSAVHLVRIRETLSVSGDPVEMIELHGPSGTPLGWAHLHHLTSERPRLSVCKEFFVWPLERGRGHGRLLEGQVAERAERWGAEQVEIPFHEADDHAGGARAAKAFAVGAGYGWAWAYGQRPNASAVAIKTL